MTAKLTALFAAASLGAFAVAYWIAHGPAMMAAFSITLCL